MSFTANTWGLFQNVEIGVRTANATHSFSFPVPFPANAEGFLLRLYTYTFKIIYLLTYLVELFIPYPAQGSGVNLSKLVLSFPPCRPQGLNSGHQTWRRQTTLLAECDFFLKKCMNLSKILCVWVLCHCVCLCTTHMPNTGGGQKRALEPLKLVFLVVVSCPVSDRSQTQVFCKNTKCS